MIRYAMLAMLLLAGCDYRDNRDYVISDEERARLRNTRSVRYTYRVRAWDGQGEQVGEWQTLTPNTYSIDNGHGGWLRFTDLDDRYVEISPGTTVVIDVVKVEESESGLDDWKEVEEIPHQGRPR